MDGICTADRERIIDGLGGVSAAVTAEAALIAVGLADKAMREGDSMPEVKIAVALQLSCIGGGWEFRAEAKAERKEGAKTETKFEFYDPKQPDLPFGDGR